MVRSSPPEVHFASHKSVLTYNPPLPTERPHKSHRHHRTASLSSANLNLVPKSPGVRHTPSLTTSLIPNILTTMPPHHTTPTTSSTAKTGTTTPSNSIDPIHRAPPRPLFCTHWRDYYPDEPLGDDVVLPKPVSKIRYYSTKWKRDNPNPKSRDGAKAYYGGMGAMGGMGGMGGMGMYPGMMGMGGMGMGGMGGMGMYPGMMGGMVYGVSRCHEERWRQPSMS